MIPPAHPFTLTEMGSNAGRFKRAFRQLCNAPSTWMLVRILIIIQSIPVIWDLVRPPPEKYDIAGKLSMAQHLLGLTKNRVLSGDFWQPFTYGFIHANWIHLLANLACIILLGSKLENIITKHSFWLLALFSLLAGSACFLLFTPSAPASADVIPQTLVGSSALCFGFLVLLTTLSPGSKFLPLFISGRSIGIAIILANLAFTLINPDLPSGPLARTGKQLSENGFGDLFQISHACHLGGSIAGFLYGKWLLRPRVTLAKLQKKRAKKEARARSGSTT